MTGREIQRARTQALRERLAELDRLLRQPVVTVAQAMDWGDEQDVIGDELRQREHDHADPSSGLGVGPS